MWFLDQNYASGELICVRLDQFQSAQLTVLKGDLTGESWPVASGMTRLGETEKEGEKE